MKLLTKAVEAKLIANCAANKKLSEESEGERCHDFKPEVKFFGGGACTWLFTEYDPEEGTFFGLCDLGQGFPELGYVSREELESVRFPPFGLPIERDRYFTADKTLQEYTDDAREKRRIDS